MWCSGGGQSERILQLMVQLVSQLSGEEGAGGQAGRGRAQPPQRAHAAAYHGARRALRAPHAAVLFNVI